MHSINQKWLSTKIWFITLPKLCVIIYGWFKSIFISNSFLHEHDNILFPSFKVRI